MAVIVKSSGKYKPLIDLAEGFAVGFGANRILKLLGYSAPVEYDGGVITYKKSPIFEVTMFAGSTLTLAPFFVKQIRPYQMFGAGMWAGTFIDTLVDLQIHPPAEGE